MRSFTVTSVLFCLLVGSMVHAGQDMEPTLEQDRALLQGKWMLRGSGHEWIFNLDPNESVQIAISWKERGGTWAATGWKWDVTEDEQGRYIQLDEPSARASELPRQLPYRLQNNQLILDVREGPLKGQHVFSQSPPTTRSDAFWLGLSILVLLLLLTAVLLFRSRRPPQTEA